MAKPTKLIIVIEERASVVYAQINTDPERIVGTVVNEPGWGKMLRMESGLSGIVADMAEGYAEMRGYGLISEG